jgi:hypothetical protein
MQIAEPFLTHCDADLATSSRENDARDSIKSRLERIFRVHRISRPIAGPRERNFWRIVDGACEASESGDQKAIAAATTDLDLLSLELCDD